MAREHQKPPWYRWYSKESSWARRMTRRQERNRTKHLLRNDKFDQADTRQTKNTQGWLTW